MIHSVRTKLLIWFFSFTLLNLFIIIISIIYIHEKDNIENLNSNIQALEVLLYKDANTINNFYLNEVENPIFYYTNSSYNIEEHNIYISGINIRIQTILDLDAMDKFELDEPLNNLITLVDSSDSKFNRIIDNILLRGYGNYGLAGKRIACLEDIETLLQKNHSAEIHILKFKNDLCFNENYFNSENNNEGLNEFQKYVNSSSAISLRNKNEIISLLDKYQLLSNKIVALDKMIGIHDDSALKKQIEEIHYEIISNITSISKEVNTRKNQIFYIYRNLYLASTFIILLFGFLLSFYSSKRSSANIIKLSEDIRKFVESKFTLVEDIDYKESKDEIGTLIDNFKILKKEIRNHINNLESIVKERTARIEEQNSEIISQHEEVLMQKDLIEKQNISMIDSIKYAKQIQDAIMDDRKNLNALFPDSFILSRTKSLVGGDFFWIKNIQTKKNNFSYFAVSDCTGHGVPGAFMSLLGITFLNDIINSEKVRSASYVLEVLRNKIIQNLQQNRKIVQDGMDLAFCIYDHNTQKLQFAGAYRPLYIIRDKKLIEIRGDRIPIGKCYKHELSFGNHFIDLYPGDKLYLFTDGYVDQFGENNQKFKKNRLTQLLLDINDLPIVQHETILNDNIDKWMGHRDQTDDMLIMGIQFGD